MLAQYRWASLAQDLAVMQVPDTPITELDIIYNTYNISEKDLQKILIVPEFQDMYRNSLEQLRAKGSRAGSMYRAGTLSQRLRKNFSGTR